jgi:hypothetical protein
MVQVFLVSSMERVDVAHKELVVSIHARRRTRREEDAVKRPLGSQLSYKILQGFAFVFFETHLRARYIVVAQGYGTSCGAAWLKGRALMQGHHRTIIQQRVHVRGVFATCYRRSGRA